MVFEFEVRETDLLGRIGTIRSNGKRLETPCLLPVVHPVSQTVPLASISAMGFKGVMTNSYIIAKRRRAEAETEGVHSMIGFDGVVMTDSGGYQVLEYGDLEFDYRQVAALQVAMGSDFAVTLDRPTGYPQTSAVARETVEYSLKNALATKKEFPEGATTWIGPIQGGLHLGLLRRSASALVGGGFDLLALGSPVPVMQNYMFADLARMIVAARKVIPYSVPLHLFGAGHPLTMALAVALGCDTFDSASYILFARNGRYMGKTGVTSISTMEFLPCSCQVCAGMTVKDLLELNHKDRTKQLAIHNLYMLREEVEACKEAIAEGRLWDLVEERSMVHPRLREAFVELIRNRDLLAEGTPLMKDKGLLVRSQEDLLRPELSAAQSKARTAVKRSSGKAILVAKGARMPRSRGPSGGADGYRFHPALGMYPAELDSTYPFGQATIAEGLAGGHGVREALADLRGIGYSRVTTVGAARGARSRRNRSGASPSPPSSSARPRSPRRP